MSIYTTSWEEIWQCPYSSDVAYYPLTSNNRAISKLM